MKSNMFIILSLVGILLVSGCKTTVVVPKPDESYTEKVSYDKQVSVFNIPVEIPLSELETQINTYLTGVLYEDKSYNDGDNLKCVVRKHAPFELSGNLNKLKIVMPLAISGSYTKLGAVVAFKGTIKAKYHTTIKLMDDWKIETVTKSQGYEWIEKPKLDLGWVELPVKWIMDLILSSQEEYINDSIDEAVEEYVDIKELMEPVLIALAEPMNVSEEYNTWFRIEPIEAFSSPLKFVDENMTITIGMKAYTESFIGLPPKSDTIRSIPLTISKDLVEGFNMELVTVMPFSEVNLVMDNEFVKSGYEYREGRYHISFTKMEMFGQAGKLIIQVGLLGSVKGDIYLIGDPYYDPETRTIRLKNLEYDFNSKQALFKSADWLAHGTLCKIMEKNMYFEIGDELDLTKKEMEEYFNDYQPIQGVFLNGGLDSLDTKDVYMIKDALVIVVNSSGTLNVKVVGLK